MSTAEEFHSLVSGLDYPMFVVTAAAPGDRAGCLVGFTTQASIKPPWPLVLLSKSNRTYRAPRGPSTWRSTFSMPATGTWPRCSGRQPATRSTSSRP